MSIFVGIELSRELRLGAGGLVPAGTLEAGGVNLLSHALKLALKITPSAMITVLTVEPDEKVLELVGEFECRESGVMQWVGQLVDAAPNAKPGDAVVILRQMVPLSTESAILQAIASLRQFRCVVSASKPPAGHERHKPLPGQSEPDYVVRAFEVWRLGEFGKYGFSGPNSDPPHQLVGWDSFVEIDQPEDFLRAGQMLSRVV